MLSYLMPRGRATRCPFPPLLAHVRARGGGGQAFFWNRFALCASVAGTRLAASRPRRQRGTVGLLCVWSATAFLYVFPLGHELRRPLRFSTAASKRTIVQPLNALITTDLWFHLQFGYLYRRPFALRASPTERVASPALEQEGAGYTGRDSAVAAQAMGCSSKTEEAQEFQLLSIRHQTSTSHHDPLCLPESERVSHARACSLIWLCIASAALQGSSVPCEARQLQSRSVLYYVAQNLRKLLSQ